MSICTIVSLIAQFYPLSFPDNKILLFSCSLCFFIFYGVLNLIIYFIEGEIIFEGVLRSQKIIIKSKMKRFDEFYSLCLEVDGKEMSCIRSSIGNYYTEKGELDKSSLRIAIEGLLDALKKKKK